MHVCELDVCSYPINPWCTMYLPWNLVCVCVCVLTLETLTHVCELQPMLCVCEPKPKPNLLPCKTKSLLETKTCVCGNQY